MRAQQYCFEHIRLGSLDELEKWCRKIPPDPAGVSRHTRKLVSVEIDTQEGFEAHIRTFTRVKNLQLIGCSFLLSPSVVECFASTSSSVILLDFDDSETTSRIITSLLAELPWLKKLIVGGSKIADNGGGTNLSSRIPFFEGDNRIPILINKTPQDRPIGSRPRHDLAGWRSVLRIFCTKRRWLSGSCTSLTSLAIYGVPNGEC